MMTQNDEEKIIALIEGTLDDGEKEALLTRIESEQDLKDSYLQLKEVMSIEAELNARSHSLPEAFVDEVMAEIEDSRPVFLRGI